MNQQVGEKERADMEEDISLKEVMAVGRIMDATNEIVLRISIEKVLVGIELYWVV